MKEYLFTGVIFLMCFLLINGFADGNYFKGQATYAFGTNRLNFASEATYNSMGDITEINDIYHSFGKGIKVQAAFGVPVMPNIDLQFESGFAFMGGYTEEDKFPNATYTEEMSAWHIPILVTVIASKEMNGTRPYAGAGAGVYLFSIKGKETSSANQSLEEYDFKVSLPIGYHGLLGLEFPAGPSMAFFGEVRFTSLSLMASEIELTAKKDPNGNDILNEIPADDKVKKFEKDSVEEEAPPNVPASSLGIFFGLKINLR